ncbi:single-stranded DNA-specific DHH superfamily exonuclease [Methanofollis sp. W23]|uniref:DHH family phosphoesterase n=1 Tax=Methanofollis sp. W23 TaxID=2817849 RepID=UPI001AE8BA06|nr:DHHA1 domain-containing protein [Methanofollis sp. W23]MBP2146196.1 single-stranded DNA-specific DHH superfamily exonuclease [Methanofollis sp. W23]
MTIQAVAEEVADQIRAADFIEVYAHHDADGIAAGAILCQAILRAGGRFRLRVRQSIRAEDIIHPESTLLCDLGAGLADLPERVMVVDHHVPHFEGAYHVNPHLAGIDGERELSASGTAYLVAQALGDHRDLVGLALLGVLGDRQEFVGTNREILNEGIANGYISPDTGLLLPGRGVREALETAIDPYIHGVSGDPETVTKILEHAVGEGEDEVDDDLLLSLLVLDAGADVAPSVFSRLYGTRYRLEREVVEDARTLTALVEGCGQEGRGGLAASICLRSPDAVEEGFRVAEGYRRRVLAGVADARPVDDGAVLYAVTDATVASGVADCLAFDLRRDTPVAVMAPCGGDEWHVSARAPPGVEVDLEAVLRDLAGALGGTGGGHRDRSGASVPADRIEEFRDGFVKAVAL